MLAVLVVCGLLLALFPCTSLCQPLSVPVPDAGSLPSSNFTRSAALNLEDILFGSEIHSLAASLSSAAQPHCAAFHRLRTDLAWQHHADSGLYATGVIRASPLSPHDASHPQSRSLLVQPAFRSLLNLLTHDGHHLPSSPLLVPSASPFHTSPVLLDANADGYEDVVWIDADGRVLLIDGRMGAGGAEPLLLSRPIRLPKLRVHKDWYRGQNISVTPRARSPVKQQRRHRPQRGRRERAPQRKRPQQQQQQADALGGGGRRLLQLPGEEDAVWEHMLDNLPEEARASLLLFSSSPSASLLQLDDDADDEAKYPLEADHVWLDAHVLATPTLLDHDHDGVYAELAISVSYFFDSEQYSNTPHLYSHLPAGTDLRLYVAGGVVVLSLSSLPSVSFPLSVHLDLTTDLMELKALVYSQPAVADLDGDGEDEIIVGTSLGMLYALSAKDGAVREGWPVVLGEVQSQAVVEDVNGDGRLDIVIGDGRGNVVLLNDKGGVLWSAQCSGAVAQAATVADVDNDGVLDVLLGTSTGQLWAFRGDTGAVLPRFPFKTNGRLIAPVTVLSQPDHALTAALPLILFPSFDGHLYIVNAAGCLQSVDVGEHVYAAVLADAVLGSRYLDLLLSTMSGNMFLLHTDIAFHPLLARTSSTSGQVDPMDYHGVFFTAQTRQQQHHRGRHLSVSFRIVDRRYAARHAPGSPPSFLTPKYNVSISLGSRIVYSHWHYRPGEYRVSVSAGEQVQAAALLRLRMVNEHRQLFEDSVVVSVNLHWYRLVKWLMLLPVAGMALLFRLLTQQQSMRIGEQPLPLSHSA